jgi:predicted transcriptional regulator of viral defense system
MCQLNIRLSPVLTEFISVPRRLSAPFFRETPIFDRAEYASAVGREPTDHVISAMLTQHLKAGNIRRISRGLFASVPKGSDPCYWPVDRFLAASRLRRGGVVVYYSALELLGFAHSRNEIVQVAAPGVCNIRQTPGFTCRFVRTPVSYGPEDLQTVDRLSQSVAVTTLECTIADLFDRPGRAGGVDELMQSLELVQHLNVRRLTARIAALDNPIAAGAVGWWLERNAERLGVDDSGLAELRGLAPARSRYALGAGPGTGRAALGWHVILPESVVSFGDGPCGAFQRPHACTIPR